VHLELIALINTLKGDITAKGKKSKCGTQNCSTMATASEHKKEEEYTPVRIHAKDATQKAKMMLGPLVSLAIDPTSKYIAPEHKKQNQFRNNWFSP